MPTKWKAYVEVNGRWRAVYVETENRLANEAQDLIRQLYGTSRISSIVEVGNDAVSRDNPFASPPPGEISIANWYYLLKTAPRFIPSLLAALIVAGMAIERKFHPAAILSLAAVSGLITFGIMRLVFGFIPVIVAGMMGFLLLAPVGLVIATRSEADPGWTLFWGAVSGLIGAWSFYTWAVQIKRARDVYGVNDPGPAPLPNFDAGADLPARSEGATALNETAIAFARRTIREALLKAAREDFEKNNNTLRKD